MNVWEWVSKPSNLNKKYSKYNNENTGIGYC